MRGNSLYMLLYFCCLFLCQFFSGHHVQHLTIPIVVRMVMNENLTVDETAA